MFGSLRVLWRGSWTTKMGGLNVEKNRVTSTLRCKVVVAGAPTVGKTSLCQMTQSSGSLFPKKYNMV